MNTPHYEPKRPPGWTNWQLQGKVGASVDETALAYTRGRALVLSSVHEMDFRGEKRWQWLISISVKSPAGQHRASDEEIARALRDFGMAAAEEDNHEPGVARKFFLLADVAPGAAPQCECKETEETVVEPNGLAWQKDKQLDTDAVRAEWEARRRAIRVGMCLGK